MGWVVNAMPRSLYHRERDPVSIVQKTGWAQGPVSTGAKNLAPQESISGPSSLQRVAIPTALVKPNRVMRTVIITTNIVNRILFYFIVCYLQFCIDNNIPFSIILFYNNPGGSGENLKYSVTRKGCSPGVMNK